MTKLPNTNLQIHTTTYGYRISEGERNIGTIARYQDAGTRFLVTLHPYKGDVCIVDSFRDIQTVWQYLTVNAGYLEARTYGYHVLRNGHGHIQGYRAYLRNDGDIIYDMQYKSMYLQSADDIVKFLTDIGYGYSYDIERGYDVFIPDTSPVSSLLSEYITFDDEGE